MNRDPLVSVIVPNYNHERFLTERLESIFAQTYKNYEIIILDDKSTDNSVKLIESYSSNPAVTHIVYNTENSGSPFIQWEKGFKIAAGDFIWIAESDDKCEPDFLQTLISLYNHNPECVLLFCESCRIDENGENNGVFSIQKGMPPFVLPGKQFIREYLKIQNIIINASSAIFKKSALSQVGDSYMSYRGCGDWVFWSEIAELGDVLYCNRPLNYYRVYNSNTTESLKKTGTGVIETYQVIRLFYKRGYYSGLSFIRRKLSIMMDVRYRKGIPSDVQDFIIDQCGFGFFYRITSSLFHLLGRK